MTLPATPRPSPYLEPNLLLMQLLEFLLRLCQHLQGSSSLLAATFSFSLCSGCALCLLLLLLFDVRFIVVGSSTPGHVLCHLLTAGRKHKQSLLTAVPHVCAGARRHRLQREWLKWSAQHSTAQRRLPYLVTVCFKLGGIKGACSPLQVLLLALLALLSILLVIRQGFRGRANRLLTCSGCCPSACH